MTIQADQAEAILDTLYTEAVQACAYEPAMQEWRKASERCEQDPSTSTLAKAIQAAAKCKVYTTAFNGNAFNSAAARHLELRFVRSLVERRIVTEAVASEALAPLGKAVRLGKWSGAPLMQAVAILS